jgi:3'-phosphoadenosine 5'-phosphosulfate sulfotransferase (PAPS reductase)/FAD synthetase
LVVTEPTYVIFASYGNDSVALIQWAAERGLTDVAVLYNDTGWARDDWNERVERMEDWVRTLGFRPHRTSSIGLEALVRQRKGWPRQGIQFCTVELKIKPTLEWLAKNDPDCQAVCMVGVRRAESANRRAFPEHTASSPNHGGRDVWAPLVDHTDEQRDALLKRAGVEPLPHRSMECFPCINSNRRDLQELADDATRIEQIAGIEQSLGLTSKGKPRTMFRPYRYMGATGIHEIVRWAQSKHGKFSVDDGTGQDCTSGYCRM